MSHFDTPEPRVYQRSTINRFRKMPGIKQETLAYQLDDDWNQKKCL